MWADFFHWEFRGGVIILKVSGEWNEGKGRGVEGEQKEADNCSGSLSEAVA